jgi:putative sigma-54 modulation protein
VKLQVIAKNNVEISETMQKYAEKKIGKLSRYLPIIGEGKVEISREESKLPEQRFTAQVTLDSKGTLIRAQEKAEDIRTAIDKVVDALTSRIERYKGKLYDKGRGISLARQEAVIKAEAEIPKKVVKTKHFLVKPMLEDEAINQMELLGHDFFLFINAENDKLNLLYRRKDGNYGLIEPELG